MRVELKRKAGEMMSHIPFGYIIQNGRAVINEEEAVKIEKLFEAYLSGLSLSEAAQKAGIKRYHTSVARMLSDKRYVEDKFYPNLAHLQFSVYLYRPKLQKKSALRFQPVLY